MQQLLFFPLFFTGSSLICGWHGYPEFLHFTSCWNNTQLRAYMHANDVAKVTKNLLHVKDYWTRRYSQDRHTTATNCNNRNKQWQQHAAVRLSERLSLMWHGLHESRRRRRRRPGGNTMSARLKKEEEEEKGKWVGWAICSVAAGVSQTSCV